jgi:ribosome-associated toxin RatA of RatAB toxin-antitoxin module
MAFRTAVLILLVTAFAAPALALSPAEVTRLQAGEPVVSIAPLAENNTIRVQAAIDIAATAEHVWSVMTDCARAADYVPGLESCRVLERDPAGRWDIREHRIAWMWFMPKIRSVFRTEYQPPKRLTFHRVDGDLRHLEGEWRLNPLHTGATRVVYDAVLAADVPAPSLIVEIALRNDMATVLRQLKAECTASPARR